MRFSLIQFLLFISALSVACGWFRCCYYASLLLKPEWFVTLHYVLSLTLLLFLFCSETRSTPHLLDHWLSDTHTVTFPALCRIYHVGQILTPYYGKEPFLFTMEGSHGNFVSIFQRPEILHSWMGDMILRLGNPFGYVVQQVDRAEFCNTMLDQGIRVALNPIYRSRRSHPLAGDSTMKTADYLEMAKFHKQKWVESTERGDMPPTVIGIRDGVPKVMTVANQIDKHLGIFALKVLRQAFVVDECLLINDTHMMLTKGKSEEEIQRLAAKYVGKPGSMQKACDEEGACALGEIADAICILHYSLANPKKMSMYSYPYDYHGKEGGVEFHWMPQYDEEMVDCDLNSNITVSTVNDKKTGSGLGGFVPESIHFAMNLPSIKDTPLGQMFLQETGLDSKDPAVIQTMEQHQQTAARLILTQQGFWLAEFVPFDMTYEDFQRKMGKFYDAPDELKEKWASPQAQSRPMAVIAEKKVVKQKASKKKPLVKAKKKG
jgi:hypothetical protein